MQSRCTVTVHQLEIKHMVKFSDTFIVGCKNYSKSTDEVQTTVCKPNTTTYS